MADDPMRRLLLELRRGHLTMLKAIDEYLKATSSRPSRAQHEYGPDGEHGYLAEVDELKTIHSGRAARRPTRA